MTQSETVNVFLGVLEDILNGERAAIEPMLELWHEDGEVEFKGISVLRACLQELANLGGVPVALEDRRVEVGEELLLSWTQTFPTDHDEEVTISCRTVIGFKDGRIKRIATHAMARNAS